MLLLLAFLSALWFPISHATQDKCTSLTSVDSIPNTTIHTAVRYPAWSNITTNTDPTCVVPWQVNAVNICRVRGFIKTSPTSTVDFEMWLPDVWFGRFLVAGNFGLGGCVDYAGLDHGSYLHFATLGTNAGHGGYYNGPAFLIPDMIETVTDFSYRSQHVAAQVGKKIISIYYGSDPHHSYHSGCSAGGRQGVSAASTYPDDFDGVIVGAPAIDWNGAVSALGIWASHVAVDSSSFISQTVWESTVMTEVLKQCDGLDGRVDGIIVDPDVCQFDPTTLMCTDKDNRNPPGCLTQSQVDGLVKFYEPIRNTNKSLLYSRFDPGAEGTVAPGVPMSGIMSPMTKIWFNYAIYRDPDRSLLNFSVDDLVYANSVDPVGISTWENALPGLAQFKKKGGKILTYHGTRDPMLPSGQAKRFYRLLAASLSSSANGGGMTDEMDEFYRLFIVPGMGHCFWGPGAWKFAQGSVVGKDSHAINQTDHSIILSMVDWVENGNPPSVLIGTADDGAEWKHCMWPSSRTVWNGEEWVCQPAENSWDLDDGSGKKWVSWMDTWNDTQFVVQPNDGSAWVD